MTLIIEISDVESGSHWDIPGTLYPYRNKPTVSTHRVKYSITSHLYFNSTIRHFIARYSLNTGNKTRIFDYDGMRHEGHAVLHPSNTLKGTLTGPTDHLRDIPDGYVLYALVYHLDGGEDAQRYFRTEQINLAKKLGLHFETAKDSQTGIPSSCELRRPRLETISDEDRSFWLPGGSSSVDYVVSSSPRKANSWHPPMATHDDAEDSHSFSTSTSSEDSSDSPTTEGNSDEQDGRELSLPPITTISPSALHSDAPAGQRETGLFSCHPCSTMGPVDDFSAAVQCRKCGLWSHIACVQPLASPPSDTDSDPGSEISWHDPKFIYKCIKCTAREDTPTCDLECALFVTNMTMFLTTFTDC